MKNKKIGVIAAAALVMTSFAIPASASGLSGNADTDSKTVLHAVEVDVDLSAIDWANTQEGELVAIGSIDSTTVTGGCTTASRDANQESVINIEEADVDVSAIDLSNIQKGEPVVIQEAASRKRNCRLFLNHFIGSTNPDPERQAEPD